MTAVKICGLTNREDARWAWQCGADLLGLVFVPASPRYVAPAAAADLVSALRAEGCPTPVVGVFAQEDLATVNNIAERCGLDLIQLHGDELPDYVRCLVQPAIVARRVVGSAPWEALQAYSAWAYLLDGCRPGQLGGTGQAWEWALAAQGRPAEARLIVAGGLTPENVSGAICAAQPWGVDVSSGVEASPGRKHPLRVADFIAAVRREECTT